MSWIRADLQCNLDGLWKGAVVNREVLPEILDELDADDPRAARSRRDLERINRVMGNHRWVIGQMEILVSKGNEKVVELGAGDGKLGGDIVRRFPRLSGQAIDLQSAPPFFPTHDRIEWLQGNLWELEVDFSGVIVVANLFLHHLQDEELRILGERLRCAAALIACEPERRSLHLWQGRLAAPLVNDVTRHDMAGRIPGRGVE